MNWVATTYRKRSDLVGELRQDASLSCVRGNLIWMVVNEELFAYEIRKSGQIWEYRKINEVDLTDQNSCPISYLKKSDILNPDWRNQLVSKKTNKQDLKKQISNAFKEAESSKQRLVIDVETQTKGLFSLEVESIVPLAGRHTDGKLYRIPLRRIKEWRIT